MEAKQLRVVNLDDEQILDLIRGDLILMSNAMDEAIVVSNGLSADEIVEQLKNQLGAENIVLMGDLDTRNLN